MKNLILTVSILFCACQLTGKTVDMTTLMKVGSNFLISKGVPGVQGASDLSLTYTGFDKASGTSVASFYVFSVNSRKGWVMVSVDDQVMPVLAYSDEYAFDINNMAPATKEWIGNYASQISFLIQHKVPAKPETANSWNSLINGSSKHNTQRTTAIVGPLLATAWNQEYPYNVLCPYVIIDSTNAVTGCVATAMAQVMKYWNWPPVGCGFHTYSDPPFGNLSANFGATAYQWALMQDDPGYQPDTAIAVLMHDAGVSVNMEYQFLGTYESNSLTNTRQSFITPCEEFALKANFHYKRSLHSIYRFGTVPGNIEGVGPDSITEATWINDLQTELNALRPISYVGYNFNNGEGHNWVCDGYTIDNYFHFNWGWGGSSNGFFTVDDLAPASLGFDLNYNQVALMGVEPDSFPSNPGNIRLQTWLTTSNTPAQFSRPFSVSTKIGNANTTSFSGDFCAQVFDTSGNMQGTLQTYTGNSLAAGDSTATLSFSSAGMFNLVPGIYSIRILYRNSGDTAWTPVANNGNFINYTSVAFYNDTDIEIVEPLSIYNGNELYQGQPLSFNAIISNWAFAAGGNNLYWPHGNFNGNIKATLNSLTDGSLVYLIQELSGQVIDTNHIDTFAFSNSSLAVPVGSYLLEIQHQYNGAGEYYLTGSTFECNPLVVNVVNAAAVQQINKKDELNIYPNPVSAELTIASSHNINQLTICNMMGQEVLSQQSATKTLSVNVSGFAPGVYFITVNGSIKQKFVKD